MMGAGGSTSRLVAIACCALATCVAGFARADEATPTPGPFAGDSPNFVHRDEDMALNPAYGAFHGNWVALSVHGAESQDSWSGGQWDDWLAHGGIAGSIPIGTTASETKWSALVSIGEGRAEWLGSSSGSYQTLTGTESYASQSSETVRSGAETFGISLASGNFMAAIVGGYRHDDAERAWTWAESNAPPLTPTPTWWYDHGFNSELETGVARTRSLAGGILWTGARGFAADANVGYRDIHFEGAGYSTMCRDSICWSNGGERDFRQRRLDVGGSAHWNYSRFRVRIQANGSWNRTSSQTGYPSCYIAADGWRICPWESDRALGLSTAIAGDVSGHDTWLIASPKLRLTDYYYSTRCSLSLAAEQGMWRRQIWLALRAGRDLRFSYWYDQSLSVEARWVVTPNVTVDGSAFTSTQGILWDAVHLRAGAQFTW